MIFLFSSIIELIQKIQEIKLRKQKKETKKVVKEEEKKIEEKDENKSIALSKGKAKETKEVKIETEKELKLKAKVLMLRILKWITQIIESFITFMISVFGVMGFFVILVVIVLMIAIYGLLHIDLSLPPGDIYNSGSHEDCIQGSQVLNQGGLSDINLGTLNGTLTPYQQNLLKTLQLVEEFIKGDGTNKPIFKTLPEDVAIKVYRGIPAVESGFELFGKSDTSHDVLKDILDDYTGTASGNYKDYWASLPRDSFIGPHQIGSTASIDYSSYYNTWSGKSFVESWKAKYPKPSNEKDHFWMPYSVAMSIMHTTMMGNYGTVDDKSNKFEEFKSYTYDRMSHFGIEKNKEECFQYIRAFLSLSCYLQGQGLSFLNYSESGGGKARIDFFCALFAASSDTDEKRSFENYSVNLDGSMKLNYSAHSSFAKGLYGKNYGTIKNSGFQNVETLANITLDENKPIVLNGKPLDVPVFRYVYEKYKDDETMQDCWKHLTSVKGQYLTSYTYGFSCLLQGNHIVSELGVSMPAVSGGNASDCDCYESSVGGDLDTIDISNITVGQAQGPWDAELLEKINNRVSSNSGYGAFKDYYGKTFISDFNSNKAEQWRVNSKWKVPYYYQSNTAGVNFRSNGLRYYVTTADKRERKGLNACGTYMLAYLMSAATGKMINPVEAFAVGLELGIFQSNGNMDYTQSNFDKLNKYGIYITHLAGGNYSSNKEKVDAVLNNGGLVGIRSVDSNNIFVGTMHFFVITEKVGDKYNVYAATGFDRDTKQSYTWEEVTKGAVRFFLVDNINRNSNNTTTKSNVDCVSKKNNYNVSAEHMTSNLSDLPGGVARSYSVKKKDGIHYEPDAPIWDNSRGTNPYETKEYFYAYDKESGYRLGMWPKDFDLTPINVSKTYNGLIWPCDSTIQGTGYEHEGADLHSYCYTPIYAPADGYITSSTWGNTVNVAPWESAYCINFKLKNPVTYNGKTIKTLWLGHLTGIRYRVQSDASSSIEVKQGELIGWMGYANAVHLHLTLDYNANIYTDEFTKFYSIGYNESRKAGQ